ncbi:MAG: peptide chain release factor 2 [Acholeplasmatales bacterium]|nr:peptide chain release factor 2 [Acholeplasmatales bacterium]
MEKYELNKFILEYKVKLNDLFDAFQIEKKKIEYKDLDSKINDSNFWDNQKEAQRIISRFNVIKDIITKCEDLKLKFDDINETIESALLDSDIMELLESEIEEFKTDIKSLEEDALLSGKYDFNDCILELHPGAGGTESMDWADMLYRMYLRFLSQKGYKVNVLDYQAGSDAGIKSVSIEVSGPFAYGRLKGERGVHRLVRISPFDSNASRHTSFCSVDISPMIDDVSEIVIKDDEIKIDVFHSSGAGGQSVNTTDSAVRITHKPTGIVVTCQNERSQIKNKEFAMNVLKSRLLEKKIREQEAELKNLKGEQMEINFGSQIRSYVFTPYTMVKDHRTGYEVSNVEGVMNGDLDGFIEAYLKYEAKNR